MQIQAAGQTSPEFDFDITGHSYNNMGWTTQQWPFTATGPSTTLEFYSLDVNGSYGPALDNVRLSCCSLPGGSTPRLKPPGH